MNINPQSNIKGGLLVGAVNKSKICEQSEDNPIEKIFSTRISKGSSDGVCKNQLANYKIVNHTDKSAATFATSIVIESGSTFKLALHQEFSAYLKTQGYKGEFSTRSTKEGVSSDETFRLKSEFHITVLARSHGLVDWIKRENRLSDQEANKLAVDYINKALAAIDPSKDLKIIFKEDALVIQKTVKYNSNNGEDKSDDRKTIITEAECRGLALFWDKLNEATGQNFAPPPNHVTLYTRVDSSNSGMGIALTTATDLAKHSSPIEVPKTES